MIRKLFGGAVAGASGRAVAMGCVLVAAASTVALSCGRDRVDEPAAVVPLDVVESKPDTAASRPEPPSTAQGRPGPSGTAEELARGPQHDQPDEGARRHELRAALDEALHNYDLALTGLVGQPPAASDPTSPLRAAWDQAVGPSTAFSAEMLAMIRQRFEQDRVVILPDASGLAYRHHTLVFTEPIDGTVSFTWCGHSPGIGHDAESGAVVDDGVAHARGTGMASRVENRWRIDSLDEFELTVLAPGAPDPCPQEVAAAERQR